VRDARLILFCVKSTDTDDAVQGMTPYLADDAVILSLQNGVDNVERIQSRVKNPVICGLVYAAAEMAGPGWVRHTGGGDVIIGRTGARGGGKESDQWLLGEIATLLANAGLRAKISDYVEADLWTKLVMNCAYNAICALSGARYGQMVAMPEIRALMHEIVDEVLRVAHAKGVRLPENIFEAVIKLADAMPQTMSSTAQDILKGKRTEIDHLNGFIVRQGEALGIPTPANRTLNALMKLLEETKLGPAS
jgi:2-dehydropantoate 2-reductase